FLSKLGTWYKSELRLKLNYDDPDGNYNGYVRFNGDKLIGAKPPMLGLGTDDNNATILTGVLSNPLDEFYIKGKIGILSAYYGNTGERGKTNRFANFSNFMDAVTSYHYGILLPTMSSSGTVSSNPSDVNNFAKNPKGTGFTTYAALGLDLSPFTLGVSGGLTGDAARPKPEDLTKSYSQGHAGLRVSGVDIADLVTFDIVYKVGGADEDTNDGDDGSDEPDGSGLWENTFAILANISAVENLGIGIGYSAFFKVQENFDNGTDTTKYTHPLYSGIDLRFAYTGVENLSVTFNNNLSFAAATGDKDPGKIGVQDLARNVNTGLVDKTKDSYIGLYNALAVSYLLADGLTARGEIGNRLTSYTFDFDGDQSIWSSDNFRVVLSADYSLNSHVGFEGGLAFDITNNTYEPDQGKGTESGAFVFGIPLRVHVVF
ncbi:MAG: hypothetical protein LBE14_08245, partial [Treponema sp.]|nr:hypothetical protein [Treponema sp.]